MSSPQAFDAIKAYLDEAWQGPPLAFENDGFELPARPDYWILVEVASDMFEQESIGAEQVRSNLWREVGAIIAHIMTPRGAGTAQARGHAMSFADLFRGQDIGGVVFGAISIGNNQPGEAQGGYFRMTVTIDWYRDR